MRLKATILVRFDGIDRIKETIRSIAEAFSNAHCDFPEINSLHAAGGQLAFKGLPITQSASCTEKSDEGLVFVTTFGPAPAMILFVDEVMEALPSRASVEWINDWPIVTCPPRDDRDDEDDPAPRLPGELEPA